VVNPFCSILIRHSSIALVSHTITETEKEPVLACPIRSSQSMIQRAAGKRGQTLSSPTRDAASASPAVSVPGADRPASDSRGGSACGPRPRCPIRTPNRRAGALLAGDGGRPAPLPS